MIQMQWSVWLLLIGSVLSSEIKIEQLPSPRSLCGEGPHWDEATQSLFYIDIYGPNATILRYDFVENKTYSATVDNEPLMTFVLPIDNTTDQFLVGTKYAAKVIRWDGKSPKGELIRTAFEVDNNMTTNRFNDAKADLFGRFFGGTQRLAECKGPASLSNASLYRYDMNGLNRLKRDIFISNGLTWVTNTKKFYYVDSCTHDLLEFDYNIDTGDLSNERKVFSLKKNGKVPGFVLDGMTSDVGGNLYITTFGGSKVMKIDPKEGKVLAEYKIPSVRQITSAAFGGPKLDILFVTTASRDVEPAEAGHLYKITGLDAVGTPGVKVKLWNNEQTAESMVFALSMNRANMPM